VAGCNPYTGSSDPFNRLNAACFTAPMPGSNGLESGLDWLYNPGLVNFDIALLRDVTVKERYHFQFRADAFNVFNHANFTGLNTTLNFNAYPTSNGVVTGLAGSREQRNALQRGGAVGKCHRLRFRYLARRRGSRGTARSTVARPVLVLKEIPSSRRWSPSASAAVWWDWPNVILLSQGRDPQNPVVYSGFRCDLSLK
jgi:hypothetical protein